MGKSVLVCIVCIVCSAGSDISRILQRGRLGGGGWQASSPMLPCGGATETHEVKSNN